MGIVVIITLATISYALFDIFASRAGNQINSSLSSFIFNGIGAILPLIIYFYLKARNNLDHATTRIGAIYSILAGVAIAVFSILLIKAFEKGGLSYVVPVIYAGSILISALVGWLIFKEQFNTLGGIGVALILVGIVLVILSRL
jgi:uncharacterized membrane protein